MGTKRRAHRAVVARRRTHGRYVKKNRILEVKGELGKTEEVEYPNRAQLRVMARERRRDARKTSQELAPVSPAPAQRVQQVERRPHHEQHGPPPKRSKAQALRSSWRRLTGRGA